MKKKKRKKKKVWPVLLSILAALVILAAVVVFLFRVRTFEVEGNSYYGENTITSWIQNDRFSVNSLYVLLKYNYTEADLPSAVEKFDISLKNPWTVHVQVRERKMAGYVDYDGGYLYFDENGTAILRTSRVVEGVPYIEGLAFDTSGVEIGKSLPVEDDSIFDKIVEISGYVRELSLSPDRMSCADGGICLYFGSVEVMLGSGNYEVKLEQVGPILQKLSELYPDTPGTLHLENYNDESESIRFVPSAQ